MSAIAGFSRFLDFVGYPTGGGVFARASGHGNKVGGRRIMSMYVEMMRQHLAAQRKELAEGGIIHPMTPKERARLVLAQMEKRLVQEEEDDLSTITDSSLLSF